MSNVERIKKLAKFVALMALCAVTGALVFGCEGMSAADSREPESPPSPDNGSDRDTREDSSEPDVRDESSWPPELAQVIEEAEVGTEGGLFTFFSDQVTLLVPVNALAQAMTIKLTRRIISVGGNDYIGYIWGPHLVALDPAAKMTVRVPKTWVPPGVEASKAGLLMVENSTELVPLEQARVETETEEDIVYSGQLSALSEVAIGPLPLP